MEKNKTGIKEHIVYPAQSDKSLERFHYFEFWIETFLIDLTDLARFDRFNRFNTISLNFGFISNVTTLII